MFRSKPFFLLLFIFISCDEVSKKQLPIYNPTDFNPKLVDKSIRNVSDNHRVKDFNLINQNGNVITSKDYENKIYVVDFFFTRCPSICPIMTDNMKLVQDEYIDDNNIKPLIESLEENTVDIIEFSSFSCSHCAEFHNQTLQELKESNLDFWANSAVNAWIDSPSHEHAISHEYYTIATITSRIEIDANSLELFFVTSFHALANDRSTISGYVYHPK